MGRVMWIGQSPELAGLALVCLLAMGEAHAACPPATLASSLAGADVVFVGRAIRTVDGGDVVFAVGRVYRGDAPAQVVARLRGAKEAIGTPPGRFLVYGRIALSKKRPHEPELIVAPCSGSGPVEALAADVVQLGPGRPPGKRLASQRPLVTKRSACLRACERQSRYTDCANDEGRMVACPCHCP